MAFTNLSRLFLVIAFTAFLNAEDELKDFEFLSEEDPEETMIAAESRSYQTIVKPPITIIKPKGVTNSHRPQYDIDSFEVGYMQEQLKSLKSPKRSLVGSYEDSSVSSMRLKPESTTRKISPSKVERIRSALQRALHRKDMDRFAQIVPIVRAMSPAQREALAELVARQDPAPAHHSLFNYSKMRSMFSKSANSSDLMLPILLDTANLIRRAARSGKEPRDVTDTDTHPQMQRRSYTDEEYSYLDDEPFDTSYESDTTSTTAVTTTRTQPTLRQRRKPFNDSKANDNRTDVTNNDKDNTTVTNDAKEKNTKPNVITTIDPAEVKKLKAASLVNGTLSPSKASRPFASSLRLRSPSSSTTTTTLTPADSRSMIVSNENLTLDLNAESTNQTMATDSPVAEKLRAINRYNTDRKSPLRRGNYPKPPPSRRTTAEPTTTPIKRRPIALRKIPPAADYSNCELFTNTLCLNANDYPTEAIVSSLRRNKAQAGALLADYKDPGDGAVDGVTAEQEAKYTADHYLTSNRRGDTASRDFASAGEAGFMCPSTVKYARPQRARATSGQWKYIVNTGEHTQTLRLEKCLKPKESCTYLTDNFKSKCVQVYNYHRLLTWDQQSGLHMDIFKVPTCCSCHIEGYSVSFPPLGHRAHETTSEPFPEDISSEHGNHAFESIQSSNQRPSLSKSPFNHNKQLEFSNFPDNPNIIPGSPFSSSKTLDNEEYSTRNLASHPVDSYGNTYYPDTFEQASSIKSVKRPLSTKHSSGLTALDSMSLPSYLEPPTPSAPVSFSFGKDNPGKPFKRRPLRQNRRPIIKKISSGPDDLISSGATVIETTGPIESLEDFNDEIDDVDKLNFSSQKRATIAPKLTASQASRHEYNTQKKASSSEDTSNGGKKVNYNYHPIIDFFGSVKEDENASIDREDSEPTYVPSSESEWKPMNHPSSRKNN